MIRSPVAAVTLFVLLLAALASAGADTPIIASIPDAQATQILAINPSGTMAGFYGLGPTPYGYGFIAKKPDLSDYQTIDLGGAEGRTFASGIAPNGTVVGYYCTAGECGSLPRLRGFVRDKFGSVLTWEHPAAVGHATTFTGINAKGQIVGEYRKWNSAGQLAERSAFLLNGLAADPIPISYPGHDTIPMGINSSGEVVGSVCTTPIPVTCSGFVWDGAEFTIFAKPDGAGGHYPTFVYAMNDRREIVGYYRIPPETPGVPPTYRGFRMRFGVFSEVSIPGKAITIPRGINNAGVIVGHCQTTPASPLEGFILPK